MTARPWGQGGEAGQCRTPSRPDGQGSRGQLAEESVKLLCLRVLVRACARVASRMCSRTCVMMNVAMPTCAASNTSSRGSNVDAGMTVLPRSERRPPGADGAEPRSGGGMVPHNLQDGWAVRKGPVIGRRPDL